MNAGERLKQIRQNLGLTQKELAEKLGFKWYKIKDMESNKQKITYEIAKDLEKLFSINPDWLLTGEGEMYKTSKNSSLQVIESDNYIKIPYYPETFAAAGAGAYNYEEAPKSITFTKTFLEDLLELTIFKGLHIINAIGDSMSPTIESGDKLFVLPFEVENHKVREGGIYVISCNFGVLVKRIYFNPFTKELILKSDNKEIPDITITGDELDGCQIIGRVVGSIKKF